jgi:hypothetical protein
MAAIGGPGRLGSLAKSGTFTGKAGLQASGQVGEFEKGHLFFLAKLQGVFFNDVAGGFLDRTQWTCAEANDIVDGVSVAAHRHCVGADKDGDRVSTVCQGKGNAPGSRAPRSTPVAPESTPACRA